MRLMDSDLVEDIDLTEAPPEVSTSADDERFRSVE